VKALVRLATALALLVLGLAAIQRRLGANTDQTPGELEIHTRPALAETAEIDSAEIDPSLHAASDGTLDSRSEPNPGDLADLAKFGGTVIDAATSRPVEGVLVQLSSKVLAKDRVRTDSHGRFGFDRDHVGSLWLEVPAQVGFRPAGDRIPVSEGLRAGEVEIVLRVERVPIAPLRARLVYPNGEPIPWCRVEISGTGGMSRQAMSDRDGRLAEYVLEFGTTSIATLLDLSVASLKEPIRAEFEHVGRDGITDVVLDAPATLLVRPPKGCEALDGFEASFENPSCSRSSRSLQPTSDALLWMVAPCTAYEARRFDGPCIVEVAHARWRGRVEVRELQGIVELSPDWRALGSLEVSARSSLDPPPDYGIEVQLARGAADVDWGSATLRELVSTPLVFDALEPGALSVRVRGKFCRTTTFDVGIDPHEITRVVADLDCESPAGFIEIRVSTRTGGALPAHVEAYAQSQLRDDLYLYETLGPSLARGANTPESIRMGPLPDGTYAVSIDASPWRVDPSEPMLARPGAILRAVVLDDIPLVDVVASAVDAATGDVLQGAWVHLLADRSRTADDEAESLLRDVPGNASVWVLAGAEGYCFVTTRIDLDDPVAVVAEGDLRRLTVRLKRGWNAYVQVYEDGSDEPVAGAVILADGAEVGRTDEDGFAEIVLDRAPRAVEARSPGWTLELREPPESPFHRFEFVARR
jgi:hypothetical protein